MNTKHITLKVGNMAKPQEFILYPYNGGEYISLQSDKRFIQVNLRTGIGYMNAKNCNYPNGAKLVLDPLAIQLPAEALKEIQGYLWHNEGKDGDVNGIMSFENKELFSL